MYARYRGVNSVTVKNRDGKAVEYLYFGKGKGAVRLHGKIGSPEFVKSYQEAAQCLAKAGTIASLIKQFENSTSYTSLSPKSVKTYAAMLARIEKKFGTFPLAAMTDKRTRGRFLEWRDEMAKSSARQADYAWTVLRRVCSWAHGRGLIDANPCTNAGKLYSGSRAEKIWTVADEKAFLDVAPPRMAMAFRLAIDTGQRQGDLLALPWGAYDGKVIRLKQSKTGARVEVPATRELKALLDASKPKGVPPDATILTNTFGEPWTSDGFRTTWSKAVAKTDIEDRTFHDLRGSFVTRAADNGATAIQIAAVTGHTLKDVNTILEAHYLARSLTQAKGAIAALERGKRRTEVSKNRPKTVAA